VVVAVNNSSPHADQQLVGWFGLRVSGRLELFCIDQRNRVNPGDDFLTMTTPKTLFSP